MSLEEFLELYKPDPQKEVEMEDYFSPRGFLIAVTSRKFLLAVAALATLAANKQYPEAVAVVLGYIGVEGVADYKGR